MSYGRNYLVGEMPSPSVGGPPSVIRFLDVQYINIKAEASNLQCGIIWLATWSRIAGEHARRACPDARVTLTAKRNNSKNLFTFECALVHLGYTDYRHPWKHKPCGWNYEAWTKRRIALSFHTGMVWPGIKMIQTEYRLVSVGVSVGPAYVPSKTCKRFKHARAVWRHPKRHIKRRKVKPYLKLMASVHLNMDYDGLRGIGFGGVPYRLCRFHELLQGSRQLLTLFIQ